MRLNLNYEKELKAIKVKNPDKCMVWAFGKKFHNETPRQSKEYWNKHHKNIFLLEGHHKIKPDLIRIGKEYKKRKQK